MSSGSGPGCATVLSPVPAWPRCPSPLQLICRCPLLEKKIYIYIKYKSTALSLGAVGHYLKPLQTSISSLWSSSGASMMFCSVKVSDSTSNVCLVSFAIWSQCRLNIDLLAIISSKPHDSLKSSIVFFRSRKACHSLSPFGNFRHLENMMHCLNL